MSSPSPVEPLDTTGPSGESKPADTPIEIYRHSSAHLLAAAMTEWTTKLQGRVAQSPPKGDTAADQLVDVLARACRAGW